MARFWLSWYQPGEDYRPKHWPLANGVVHYWCTGTSDTHAALCAVVDAENECAAKAAIEKQWGDGNVEHWRFCNEHAADWMPSPGRFPLPAKA